MATTSTLGLFRAALVTALDTGDLSGKVYYAWPGPKVSSGSWEVLWFDEITEWSQTIPNNKYGRKQRQERYVLEGVLWVAKPDVGLDGAQATFERALELAAIAENAFANDVQLGDTNIDWAVLSERKSMLIPFEKGWGAEIVMSFEGNTRLT